MILNPLVSIAQQFKPDAAILDLREYGSGNVNDTYLVTLDDACEPKFILQRINPRVFHHPELIMLNMCLFTQHIQHRLATEMNGRRWEMPNVLPARDGKMHVIDDTGAFWRALSFVDQSRSFDQVQDAAHAREVGFALGKFHHLVSDLDATRLFDTLEGFHITPRYLEQYDDALRNNPLSPRTPLVDEGIQFIENRRLFTTVLEDAKAQGRLRVRAMHGDPKVNNIMIDDRNGQAVSIVDLDTVKPGLVHYDIGDCLRSSCNPLGEETTDFDAVRFDADLARAILCGYLPLANEFLSQDDYAFLYDAIRLLPFELGIRFLTDYLNGNVYFKIKHPEHNLHRAVVQFKLTASIEAQEKQIRAIIDDWR